MTMVVNRAVGETNGVLNKEYGKPIKPQTESVLHLLSKIEHNNKINKKPNNCWDRHMSTCNDLQFTRLDS